MKRILLSFLLLVGMATAGTAQTQIIMGDMNRDGVMDIADVTYLVDVLLGKKEMQYITRDDFGKPVTGITLDKTSLTLGVGGTATLTATIIPSDAGELGIIWTSSDPSVVSVSSAASSSAGGYEIFLESFGSDKVAVIKVVREMTGLGLVDAKALVESAPVSLGTYDSATAATHQAALEEAGATVTLNALGGGTEGEVTALATGTATITATTIDGGYTATCTVTVGTSHEYVDMGNGQLWATCNIGADSPEEYGDYLAWGETAAKTSYSWSNYAWGSSETSLTKYVTESSYGTVDGKTMLEAGDDAATAWGNDWRTPTQYEWEWLHNNCNWEWTNDYNGTGVKGYVVTSNITSNSIFLPAAGNTEGDVGSYGYYWSSTLVEDNSSWAINMFLHTQSMIFGTNAEPRYKGLTVRPVCSPRVAVSGIELNASSIVLEMGQTFYPYITATLLPENAFNKIITWTCSDENVVNFVQTAYNYGYLVPKGLGTATITATTEDGGYIATCKVYVVEENHPYVELGDGLKWASYNVGASSPEQYGDYFAWGDPESKENTTNGYTWVTYKHMTSGLSDWKFISKYQADDGKTDAIWYYDGNFTGDGKTTLEQSDDAASVNWGGSWRIPTKAEWETLMDTNKFMWTWTNDYNGSGVAGYSVTSKIPGYTGNHIFLPAAGYRNYTNLNFAGSYGFYWSTLLDTSNSSNACALCIYSSEATLNYYNRSGGQSVRAVSE